MVFYATSKTNGGTKTDLLGKTVLAARKDEQPPGWYLNRLEYSLSADDSGSNPDHTDHAELVAPQTLILFPSEKNRQRYLPIRGAITVGSIINGP